MKRPKVDVRPTDDKTIERETGLTRAQLYALMENAGAGRSALGKALQAKKVDATLVPTLLVDFEAHAGITEKDGRPKGYSVCSTKTVDASASRAFGAFTSADDLDQWFGPKTSISAKEGGTLANGDGNRGTITKLRADKALVFTWDTPGFAEGSVVEVLFQPKGDKCGLVVNHTRIMTRQEYEEIREMWSQALNGLKTFLAS
jgi:uncharacterized protein YndB with AHSA1/START domain